ncbi:MAG TPA: toll/interleukin-1 receptor domain-containing protein, partial [Ktedonobacterales bacterium]|nr:toll/interleukin-1 receptor domain-containing protein [Ktedonobacterales bacterium]
MALGVPALCPAVLVPGLHTQQRTFLHLPRRLSIRYTDERVCAFFGGQTPHRRQASSRRGGQCSPSPQVRGLSSKENLHIETSSSPSPSSSIPRHAFISYAHADAAFVDRLVEDLERAGIPCWVDCWGLQPGTPNWEQAIRAAIADAFAVLLIASPASRQALAVQGEMALASGSASRIIPLWVAGDRWEDSAALTLLRTQYVDCRGERYADARAGI